MEMEKTNKLFHSFFIFFTLKIKKKVLIENENISRLKTKKFSKDDFIFELIKYFEDIYF